MTHAEGRLWYYLRAHRFLGLHIRRQVPIGPYVADFLCESQRLVIEVDGGQHAERCNEDEERSCWLRQHGYRVLRFWNNEVLENTAGVLERIAAAVTPSPALPQGGGRKTV
jgi:very-short-patch-repair endonuclease